jgi:bifunctional DNA-binding transcriptional regulator/antitoxin component of YhaV-PrlF toxin-antitoxin module
MTASDQDEVTTTVTMGLPKHQVTVPIEVRRALGIDGNEALLQATFSVVRVLDEDSKDEGGSS